MENNELQTRETLAILGVYCKDDIEKIVEVYNAMITAQIIDGSFPEFLAKLCRLADQQLKDWNYSFDPEPEQPDPEVINKHRSEFEELAVLGGKMRLAQSEYFRTKSSIALTTSKKLEKDFDEIVKPFTTPKENPVPTQNTLF